MANATARVGKGTVDVLAAQYLKRSVETLSAETTFYVNAMIGVDATGYYCKGDDTQSWIFAGVVRGREGNPVLPIGTAGDSDLELDVQRPVFFELAIASVAVTDIGKAVYAIDDQTGTLDPTSRTYGNLVGTVAGVAASGIALVKAAYGGLGDHAAMGAVKYLAATGTLTLSKLDLMKTIIINNTGAQTINLPPVADCPAGTWFQFVKKSTAASAATLDADGSEEIDSATTYAAIDAEHDCALLISDGTQWHIANRDIA